MFKFEQNYKLTKILFCKFINDFVLYKNFTCFLVQIWEGGLETCMTPVNPPFAHFCLQTFTRLRIAWVLVDILYARVCV